MHCVLRRCPPVSHILQPKLSLGDEMQVLVEESTLLSTVRSTYNVLRCSGFRQEFPMSPCLCDEGNRISSTGPFTESPLFTST